MESANAPLVHTVVVAKLTSFPRCMLKPVDCYHILTATVSAHSKVRKISPAAGGGGSLLQTGSENRGNIARRREESVSRGIATSMLAEQLLLCHFIEMGDMLLGIWHL